MWLLGEKANSQVFLQGMRREGELPFLAPSLTCEARGSSEEEEEEEEEESVAVSGKLRGSQSRRKKRRLKTRYPRVSGKEGL